MEGYGILGERLSSSSAPRAHALLWNDAFTVHEVPPEELGAFLARRAFRGLTVSMPYKKAVIPFCDALDPLAERIGSVNALLVEPDGSLKGYNTDYYGFAWMVKRAGVNLQGAKVLVLGTGGTAAAAEAVAADLGAREVVPVSRGGEADYTSVYALHSDAEVIVNATPVGMYPDNGSQPIRLTGFRQCRCVLDMIYNPLRTTFLLEAEHCGIPCEGGLTMFVAQAKRAAEIFSGKEILEARIGEVCTRLMEEGCNIVLIGMPGSGKSYFGKLIAKQFGRRFIDMDAYIEQAQGRTIPEIFAQQGEPAFRDMEVEASRVLGCRTGLVISTGGGTVVRKESMDALRQNGCVFFVDRPLPELATEGRPLSEGGESTLRRLYDARIGLYTGYADVSISNAAGMNAERIAETVLREYERVCAAASLPRWGQMQP